jgi:hypothetical protein
LFEFAAFFSYGFSLGLCFVLLSALRDVMLDADLVIPPKGKALGWLVLLLLAVVAFSILFLPLKWIASLSGTSLVGPTVALSGLVTGCALLYAQKSRFRRFFAATIGSKPAARPVAK